MRSINVQAVIKAPPEALWSLLADVTTWPSWGPWLKAELLEEGGPTAEGVGAVRKLRSPGGFTSVEQIVRFEPGRALGYVLRDGLPLRDYRADVTLVPLGGETVLTWHSTFGGPYAWFFGPGLKRFIARVVRDLARAVERGSLDLAAGQTRS